MQLGGRHHQLVSSLPTEMDRLGSMTVDVYISKDGSWESHSWIIRLTKSLSSTQKDL